MVRECVRLAREEQRVVVFVEPIALYMTRDLHEEGDGLGSSVYEAPGAGAPIRLGQVGGPGDGDDLGHVRAGDGYYLCRPAAEIMVGGGGEARGTGFRQIGREG